MKILYLECNMGAAGDMLMSALLELHDNPEGFMNRLNNAGIPKVTATACASVKCGITGTRVKVSVDGHEEDCHPGGERGHSHSHEHHHGHHHGHGHNHNGYHDVGHLISRLDVPDSVKGKAREIYRLIADAESNVHGKPVNEIHFHEVGAMDAVADIIGVCMLIEELSPDMVLASPVNVGSGHVRCAHGILPVPAPATAHILKNVPIYSGDIEGELCTPTGAAILKYFAKEFCKMPVMSVSKLGYGMGKKDFEKANCVRAYLGDAGNAVEEVVELVCNLDDMTPESIAFAQRLLLEEGALDVYTVPIGMKKGRFGFSFTCMCRTDERDKMLALIFKHTTTLGVRENLLRRYTLQREEKEISTGFGKIKVKTAYGYGAKRIKPEYEDIAKLARENNKSINEILKEVRID